MIARVIIQLFMRKSVSIQTMTDIAVRLGVSRAAVSAVLANNPGGTIRVSPATRARIQALAGKLNFRPSAIARSMVTGQSRVVGYLTVDGGREHAAQVLAGAAAEAARCDYYLKYMPYDDAADFDRKIQACLEYRLAGVICRSVREPLLARLRAACRPRNLPVAMVDDTLPHKWGIRVIPDNVQGMRLLVEHLARLGHRRIAHLTLLPERRFVRLRLQALRAALRAAGLRLPADRIVHVARAQELAAPLTALLQSPRRPTALICIEDYMAMAAIQVVHRLGYRIPGDISIAGYANLGAAAFADPPLTTVAQPFVEMGRTAMRLLAEEIKRTDKITYRRQVEAVLPVQLVARESTGANLS